MSLPSEGNKSLGELFLAETMSVVLPITTMMIPVLTNDRTCQILLRWGKKIEILYSRSAQYTLINSGSRRGVAFLSYFLTPDDRSNVGDRREVGVERLFRVRALLGKTKCHTDSDKIDIR